MKERDILNDVLWLAIEDVSGLWEVLWDMKARYPTMVEDERKAVALRAVRDLIRREWIELYSRKEPGGEPLKLPQTGLDTVLGDAGNWREPEPGTISIRIGATDAGRRVLTGGDRAS